MSKLDAVFLPKKHKEAVRVVNAEVPEEAPVAAPEPVLEETSDNDDEELL